MKGLIPFILVVGALGGGAYYIIQDLQHLVDDAQFESKINAQRVLFAEQSPIIAMVPDDKAPFDKAQLMGWHRRKIDEVYAEHPMQKIDDRYIKSLEKKSAEGKMDKATLAKFKERHEWMTGVWDKYMKVGDYKPLFTAAKSGVRLDIVNISPWRAPEGGPQSLKIDLIIWGMTKDQLNFSGMKLEFFTEETLKLKKKGQEYSKQEIEGAGPPNVLHPNGPNKEPMDWILEWPPGVGAGYYTGLPLFPPDATTWSFKVDLQQRSQGGTTIPIEFLWEDIEIRPEWRGSSFGPQGG